MQNNTYTAPDNQAPDWIDYGRAEAALFAALNGPGGYARVLAQDYARQFGADIAEAPIVNDLADALFPKAAALLQEHGTRRAFGDANLLALCRQWAAHWAEQFARRYRDRADAIDRNAADRLAYIRRKWTAEQSAKGRDRARRSVAALASVKALRARILTAQGLTAPQIAGEIGCTPKHTYKLKKRPIGRALLAAVLLAFVGYPAVKAVLVPTHKASYPVSEKPLRADTLPQISAAAPEPPPPAARDVDKIDIIGELLKHWRATDGQFPDCQPA